jgi:thymidine kinase
MFNANLEILIGGMAGDKTGRLITLVEQLKWQGVNGVGIPHEAFKPSSADRGEGNFIQTRQNPHSGHVRKIPAKILPYDNPLRIIRELDTNPQGKLVQVVAINELHMWDAALLGCAIDELMVRGKRVIGDVLLHDHGGRPMQIVNYLVSRMAKLEWLFGYCTDSTGCQSSGTHSQRYQIIDGRRSLYHYKGQEIQAGDETGEIIIMDKKSEIGVDYQPRCGKHFIIPPLAKGFVDTGLTIKPIPSYSDIVKPIEEYSFSQLMDQLGKQEVPE